MSNKSLSVCNDEPNGNSRLINRYTLPYKHIPKPDDQIMTANAFYSHGLKNQDSAFLECKTTAPDLSGHRTGDEH